MKKVRLGIIGCGGRSYAHVNKLVDFEDVEIVAVADPILERRVKMAEKTGAARLYADHNELFASEHPGDLDAVYICVEPTAHVGMEERAIENGWHFVIEKPMTLSLAQAEGIAKEVGKKGLITWVGFQDRYLDIVDAMRKELPSHKSGLVYGSWLGGVPMVWWWMKKSTCGGQLVEQNIHLLDLLRYLYGEPRSVYATCSRGILSGIKDYETDDHSTAVIQFENSVTATLTSACYLKPDNNAAHSGFIITLDDMTIDYRLRRSVTFSDKARELKLTTMNDTELDANRVFIDAVKSGDGSKIRSPYSDALETLRLGLAANESMETGNAVHFKKA
jgi:myo-inositol 2-dehydrogenase / D-chiro-inositol 1-dehydrogenase